MLQCSNSRQPQSEQEAAPVLEAVLARGDRLQETPFHVPGHKVHHHWLSLVVDAPQVVY
jgi:hypothetical protein